MVIKLLNYLLVLKLLQRRLLAPVAAMANLERKIYALQFHPEVTHTKQGTRMLEHFVIEVCGCERSWTMPTTRMRLLLKFVLKLARYSYFGTIWWWDSSVAGVLIHKAIGAQLQCIFVDTGAWLNEAQQVMQNYHEHLNLKHY